MHEGGDPKTRPGGDDSDPGLASRRDTRPKLPPNVVSLEPAWTASTHCGKEATSKTVEASARLPRMLCDVCSPHSVALTKCYCTLWKLSGSLFPQLHCSEDCRDLTVSWTNCSIIDWWTTVDDFCMNNCGRSAVAWGHLWTLPTGAVLGQVGLATVAWDVRCLRVDPWVRQVSSTSLTRPFCGFSATKLLDVPVVLCIGAPQVRFIESS